MFLSSITGNSQLLDGGAMFGNAPRTVWEKWCSPDSLGRIKLECRCLLVETSVETSSDTKAKKILCETGIGDFFDPKLKSRYGVGGEEHVLLSNLKNLGVDPVEITHVILSHLHFDHAGGLISSFDSSNPSQAFKIVFPNASIFIGESAWERAMNPHPRDRASFVPEVIDLLKQDFAKGSQSKIKIVKGASHPDLPPEIRFHYSDGHTPGQMHTVLETSENRIFFAGDLIPGTPWVHLPITMGYDRFPEKLIDEKSEILQEWTTSDRDPRKKSWVFYTHDEKTAMSQILFDGKKFTPVEPMTELIRWKCP